MQKAVNSREKHEKSPKKEEVAFETVCPSFRVFLCLFVAIPTIGFAVSTGRWEPALRLRIWVWVAGVERSEPPVIWFRGLTSFDPGHPQTKL